jgi:lysophospholipase L1-like esterase
MKALLLLLLLVPTLLLGREAVPLPDDPFFAPYSLEPAPAAGPLMLGKGDQLAICGDSITEQKRYSLIMESYLTACMPELQVTCRQFGWSGEQAAGFLPRMKNDVLRFEPDVATTCYGMNDFRYVPYDPAIAEAYERAQTAVVRTFQEAGCEVVVGSPGIIDSVPPWVKTARGTKLELNQALSRFRNLGIEVARVNEARFADVYRPMLVADWQAKKAHGEKFMVAGKDGVHPGWAGQLIMAHAFLKSLGLDGDLGTITLDGDQATGAGGHVVKAVKDGAITVVSSRFPFAAGPGEVSNDDSLRAGLALVPFDRELNRFVLRLKNPTAARYTVSWGKESREYEAGALKEGINLAADFIEHPLLEPFRRVWDAAAAKQAYETRQMKMLMHGPEGEADIEATVALTEKVHAKLASDLAAAMQPVEHVIRVVPGP